MVVITAVTVTGTGVLGGVYAAFSLMVMPALRRLEPRDATAAMVAINRVAERGPFVVLFGGVAVAAAALAASAVSRGATAEIAIAGASLASTAVTIAVNVPLNHRLAREGATLWPEYARRWTRWNTIRAIPAILAVVIAVR